MTPQELKNSILQLAIEGRLVEQREEEGTAEELYAQIQAEKAKLIAEGKLKKQKALPEIMEAEMPFEIPKSWKWVRLGEIVKAISAGGDKPKNFSKSITKSFSVPVIANGITNEGIFGYTDVATIKETSITVSGRGTIGYTVIRNYPYLPIVRVIVVLPMKLIDMKFLKYSLDALLEHGIGSAVKQLTVPMIIPKVLPLPPLAEQHRIVAKIEELLPHIERYEKAWSRLEDFNKRFPSDMQKSLLQYAIEGRLVEQRKEEGTAEELIGTVKLGDSLEGRRVKKKNINEYDEKDFPFEIPATWKWEKLGNICLIARGGSPRPIKTYLTNKEDGINWIKIGDTEKNSKYICHTAEKITIEGSKKSRFVHAGDFLLTNSMSFGRPYILKIDGCIHDGWLVISQKEKILNEDFLYCLLSSSFAYNQFAGKVSGAVVKNLNSEKVANSFIPIPPLAEQHRIVARLEELLPLCERLKK